VIFPACEVSDITRKIQGTESHVAATAVRAPNKETLHAHDTKKHEKLKSFRVISCLFDSLVLFHRVAQITCQDKIMGSVRLKLGVSGDDDPAVALDFDIRCIVM
jgi:hypothetical protein